MIKVQIEYALSVDVGLYALEIGMHTRCTTNCSCRRIKSQQWMISNSVFYVILKDNVYLLAVVLQKSELFC